MKNQSHEPDNRNNKSVDAACWETYKYHFMLFTNIVFNAKPLLCFSFFYFLIWNKKVKNVTQKF